MNDDKQSKPTKNNSQQDLIEFVTNPDNLKKAAEGSMQKRIDFLNKQPCGSDTLTKIAVTDEYLEAICDVCHKNVKFYRNRYSKKQWDIVINRVGA